MVDLFQKKNYSSDFSEIDDFFFIKYWKIFPIKIKNPRNKMAMATFHEFKNANR